METIKTKRIAEITLELQKSENNPILITELVEIIVINHMEDVLKELKQIEKINSVRYGILIGMISLGMIGIAVFKFLE